MTDLAGERIIRLAQGYELAVAVTPPDASPHDHGSTFHRWAAWEIGGQPAFVWNEISHDAAMAYFGSIADGLGRETLPASPFADLASAGAFMLAGHAGSRAAILARIEAEDADV